MFIKLQGIKGNRLIFNVDSIKAVQEIVEGSKYAEYKESGAKSMVQIDDKVVPVKDSIIQVENKLKKLGAFGGAS